MQFVYQPVRALRIINRGQKKDQNPEDRDQNIDPQGHVADEDGPSRLLRGDDFPRLGIGLVLSADTSRCVGTLSPVAGNRKA